MPGGDAGAGEQVITDAGCGACHVIPGIRGANSTVGPPLTDWADRVYIAGALPNRPEYLVRWLLDPQEIEPGTAMPDLFLTEQQARDASAYLFTLR
ncbi:MAG: c-type cytochrome [Anaerolineales bacterium]|nr:c-type cytochrome [Anaerolineales bacterium]